MVQWNLKNEIEAYKHLILVCTHFHLLNGLMESGLKAIQYMAMGIPCVASNTGDTSMLINNRVNGFLVNTDEQWVDVLEELVLNPKLRQIIGKQARFDAEVKYSLSTIGDNYDKILNSIIICIND